MRLRSSPTLKVPPVPPNPTYLGEDFWKKVYPFTSKSRSVDVNFVDGIVIVAYCKDELHLFSTVGLGAVKQGSLTPEAGRHLRPTLEAWLCQVVWLYSFAHIPSMLPILLPFCFVLGC